MREPRLDRGELGPDRQALLPVHLARRLVGKAEEHVALRLEQRLHELVGCGCEHVAVDVDGDAGRARVALGLDMGGARAGGSAGVEHDQSPPVLFGSEMSRQACHTLSGVAGMSSPAPASPGIASAMAFMTAASAPVVPASPAPLMPSALVVQ